jgi:DegV family protein with EDD domain
VRDIISIHMTSKGSGAYQAAVTAKSIVREEMPELSIETIDTLNASLCQGWMVIEAAREAAAGKSLAEISARVRELMLVTRMMQTADTLRYLYLGGRIGMAKNLVGSLLNVKPVVGMEDGIIVPLGTARSRDKAYRLMADLLQAAVGTRKINIAYVHAAALEEAKKIKSIIDERFSCVESLFAELSPALGVYTGPGTAGICYYPVST